MICGHLDVDTLRWNHCEMQSQVYYSHFISRVDIALHTPNCRANMRPKQPVSSSVVYNQSTLLSTVYMYDNKTKISSTQYLQEICIDVVKRS